MKGFAMDNSTGDVLIENGQISLVVGDSLTQQKVLTVLRTNLREWFFDWEQGIDRTHLIGKGVGEELARYEVERGLQQVDNTFSVTEFTYEANQSERTAKITFKATTESGEEVGGEITWD